MTTLRSSLPSRLRQLLSSEGAIGPSIKLDSEPVCTHFTRYFLFFLTLFSVWLLVCVMEQFPFIAFVGNYFTMCIFSRCLFYSRRVMCAVRVYSCCGVED